MSYAEEIHRMAMELREEEHERTAEFFDGFRKFARSVRGEEEQREEEQPADFWLKLRPALKTMAEAEKARRDSV